MICLHAVKRFQVLLCITNNSIKHQSFVYKQLNDKTVLFQPIQFSISNLFALSLNVTVLFDLYRGPCQVLLLQVRVHLGAMAKKGSSAFPKAPDLREPHHRIVWCHIHNTTCVCKNGGVLDSFRRMDWPI